MRSQLPDSMLANERKSTSVLRLNSEETDAMTVYGIAFFNVEAANCSNLDRVQI